MAFSRRSRVLSFQVAVRDIGVELPINGNCDLFRALGNCSECSIEFSELSERRHDIHSTAPDQIRFPRTATFTLRRIALKSNNKNSSVPSDPKDFVDSTKCELQLPFTSTTGGPKLYRLSSGACKCHHPFPIRRVLVYSCLPGTIRTSSCCRGLSRILCKKFRPALRSRSSDQKPLSVS